MQYDESVELGVKPVRFWAYGKTGKFVCRVELNSAGVAIFSGITGQKRLADVRWEAFVRQLKK
jgi:hypothetical protein